MLSKMQNKSGIYSNFLVVLSANRNAELLMCFSSSWNFFVVVVVVVVVSGTGVCVAISDL